MCRFTRRAKEGHAIHQGVAEVHDATLNPPPHLKQNGTPSPSSYRRPVPHSIVRVGQCLVNQSRISKAETDHSTTVIELRRAGATLRAPLGPRRGLWKRSFQRLKRGCVSMSLPKGRRKGSGQGKKVSRDRPREAKSEAAVSTGRAVPVSARNAGPRRAFEPGAATKDPAGAG